MARIQHKLSEEKDHWHMRNHPYLHVNVSFKYSSPPLIRPPYLRTNCGHIREVAFGEREKSIDFTVVRTENSGLIRGVASRESGL